MAAAYSPAAVSVVEEWKANERLVTNGAKCCIAIIGRKDQLNRSEVAENFDLLQPIIRHIGFLNKFRYLFFFDYPWKRNTK